MSATRSAILISISASDNSGDSPYPQELDWLECPARDVDGLAEVLNDPALGAFTHVALMKGMPHYDVLTGINEALNAATREDLFLIYYSGHGKLSRSGELHLVTANTRLQALQATSIPFSQIAEFIKSS